MKIEIEVEDSVYETMTSYLDEEHGITLEQFLVNYLTQTVALAMANPEMAIELGEKLKEVPGGEAWGARLTRKPSDDRS